MLRPLQLAVLPLVRLCGSFHQAPQVGQGAIVAPWEMVNIDLVGTQRKLGL